MTIMKKNITLCYKDKALTISFLEKDRSFNKRERDKETEDSEDSAGGFEGGQLY